MPTYSAILATDAAQNIAIDATARTLSLPAYFSPNGSTGRAIILVRTAAVLFTTNGTAPTAADESTGDKAVKGARITVNGQVEMKNIKMIRATSTDAAVFVRYEKKVD